MWQLSSVGEFSDDDGTAEAAFVAQLQDLFAGLPDGVVRSFSLQVTADVPMIAGSRPGATTSTVTIKQAEEAALQKAVDAALNAKQALDQAAQALG